MTDFWKQCSTPCASVVEMMLDIGAEELAELEQPEILSYLPDFAGKRVMDLGAGIGWVHPWVYVSINTIVSYLIFISTFSTNVWVILQTTVSYLPAMSGRKTTQIVPMWGIEPCPSSWWSNASTTCQLHTPSYLCNKNILLKGIKDNHSLINEHAGINKLFNSICRRFSEVRVWELYDDFCAIKQSMINIWPFEDNLSFATHSLMWTDTVHVSASRRRHSRTRRPIPHVHRVTLNSISLFNGIEFCFTRCQNAVFTCFS